MSIAIPDVDLPTGSSGCSISEIKGMQLVVTECANQGGLFWRISCGDSVEIDVTDKRVRIKNENTFFEVKPEGIFVTGSLVLNGIPLETHVHPTSSGDTGVMK
jgi:hypothetical protein